MVAGWGATVAAAAPQELFAGIVTNGNQRQLRLGWFAPDDWESVQLRSWEVSTAGGVSAVADDDFLYREEFSGSPAMGSPQKFDLNDWPECTDLYDQGFWDDELSTRIYKSSRAGVVQIGIRDASGSLVSQPIPPLSGSHEEFALVVRACKADNETALRQLSVHFIDGATAATNRTVQQELATEFSELVFPLTAQEFDSPFRIALTGNLKGDRRAYVDTIALVRGYEAQSPVTNILIEARDLGAGRYADLGYWADGTVRNFALRGVSADSVVGDWSEPVAVDPAQAEEWRPNWLPLSRHAAEVALEPDLLSTEGDKVSIAKLPFMAVVDGKVARELSLKNAAVRASSGAYLYTNVFGCSWIALVPGAPKSSADFRMSEMRVCVAAEGTALRQLAVQVECAQLSTFNSQEKSLQVQCRSRRPGDAFTDWSTMAEYRSKYTSKDNEPDLTATRQILQSVRRMSLPAGAVAEVRICCVKSNDSGYEPPLAWRNLRVSAEGGQGFSITVR